MFVIGTAGHVDHGKSTLVHRLTGIDPDRLEEEKQRGMTIDLGFAWLTLPSGRDVSLVDVPGHERFVKNMLAGVGGIDLALLVVAADEGVMPQTREHLAIIDLLRIPRGVVALTKRDLVEPDWLELVADEVREALDGTVLAEAPLLPVSAASGEGLDGLLSALDGLLDGLQARPSAGAPRLPIDRVFSLTGHGTVVTGTLLDGTLRVGDEVEILPERLRARIRSLQTHRQRVEEAHAGARVAANLVGLTVEQLRRGDVLAAPGALAPTTTIDVSLRLLAAADKPLRSGDEVLVYTGAAEIPALVRMLDGEAIAPEADGVAQLRLAHPTAVRRGDGFIIRRPSPAETIGGGQILDPRARRARRGRGGAVLAGELEEHELVASVLASRRLWSIGDLAARLQLPPEVVGAALRALRDTGEAVLMGDAAASVAGWQSLGENVRQLLSVFHGAQPLRFGMPREEARERLAVPPALWPAVSARLAEEGIVRERGGLLHRPAFAPRPTAAQAARIAEILGALRAGGSSPPTLGEITGPEDAPLLAYLVEQRELVRLNDQVAYPTATYQALVGQVVAALERGPATVAQLRDVLGASRRYTLALLEQLDAQKITRRNGDERTLLRRPDAAPRA